MAGIIGINGDFSTQPSKLKEELQQKVHDRVSIKGTYTRIWMAQKHIATLTYTALSTSQYNTLIAYFTGTANPVHYQNLDTGYNFIGFPSVAEAEYYQGASFLKDLNVTITER